MQNLTITNAGQALIARLVSGETTAVFTRMKTSNHDYSSVDVKTITSLADVKQDVAVSDVSVASTDTVKVLARFDNAALTAGYYIRTIGLYAKDGDGTTILYAVGTAGEVADWMPAFGGTTTTGYCYTLRVNVSRSSAVTIVVDPAAVASEEQIEEISQQQFLDLYGLCNKVTTITKASSGTTVSIVENSDDGMIIATTVFADASSGKMITTTVVPSYGSHKYVKTAAFEDIDTNGSKRITESYSRLTK